ALLRSLEAHSEVRGFETRMYRKDGRTLWVSLSVRAVHDGIYPEPLYYEGFLQDISDRKHTETVSEILFRTSAAAAATRNLDELFAAIHDTLIELLRAHNFFIALVNTEQDRLTFPYFKDTEDEYLDIPHISDPAVSSPTLRVIRERAPLHLLPPDFANDKIFIGTQPQVWIGVPLVVDEETIGAMVIQDYLDPDHFPDDAVDILIAISDHVALAIERKMAQEALACSEEKYRSIFENSIEGIFQSTIDGTLLAANPAMARILGHDSVDALLKAGQDTRYFYKDLNDRNRYVQQIIEHGSVKDYEFQSLRPDGSAVWVSLTAQCVRDDQGDIQFFEGIVEDISRKKKAEAALERQKTLFQQLFENSPQAITHINVDNKAESVNAAFETLFGYTQKEMQTTISLFDLVPEEKREECQNLRSTIFAGGPVHKETLRIRKDGTIFPVSLVGYPVLLEGEPPSAFIIYNDISQRKQYETQLTHQALHDPLTGLANRTLFLERLERAMQRAHRRDYYSFAVLLIDLDRFKRVNDSLGHQAGDKLLIEVARRIGICVRSMDTIARLGGDEFAILLEEFNTTREALQITRRIQERIRDPFLIEGSKIFPSASTGIVLKTDIYTTPEEVLRDADISMYRAKEQGKNRFKVFNQAMHEQAIHAVQMEAEIRRGIPKNEFYYEYQPIHLAEDLCIAGFEALTRWNHPQRGLVSPGEFVPVAEESGLIVSLGRAVLENACRTAAGWKPVNKHGKFTLAVNLSQRQLSQASLVDDITEVLRTTGFPPERLKLEITETTIMENAETALVKLKKLKDLGVAISVDDFGTGYSSLSYLHRFPVDMLKIDRSFVNTMFDKPENKEIVKTIIILGHTLGLEIVAEGVETKQQLTALQDLGCDYLQGFYFSKPVGQEEAEGMLLGG
ncbi:MAG: EAL domain-containing protein, partial [Proteobacteria bacterium]|nr:EAL domain-containing protein [Pseudomonadota bacterium]